MFANDADLGFNTSGTLVFYVRSKAAWPNQKSIRIAFRDSNNVVLGSYVTLDDGIFGFSSGTLGSYQQVAIPLNLFNIADNTLFRQLRMEIRGSGAAIGFYIDDVILQDGVSTPVVGITQEQADARYLKLVDQPLTMTLGTMEGTLTVDTSPFKIYNLYGENRTITRVGLSVGTAPTGASILVDVFVNGTTIFTTQSNRPAITAGNDYGESSTIEAPTWTADQPLTWAVEQIGSTIAGADLVVHIVSRR
jgi:hypothetical protein